MRKQSSATDSFAGSRVLLDPAGVVILCTTAVLDLRGVGVAKLLVSAKAGFDQVEESPLAAMEHGDVPFIPPERFPGVPGALQLVWDKIAFRSSISFFGSFASSDSLWYFDVDAHPGVRNYVALTIDDAPCRLSPKNSMLPQVRSLLKQHGAQATFMLLGKFIAGNEDALADLLKDGHELGNHCLIDKSYMNWPLEDFEDAVDECSSRITSLQRSAGVEEGVRWFRAPHGRLNAAMSGILKRKGLTNVMSDTYACCPVIQDGDFIGKFLGKTAQHGSIIVIHMPERGFREWCWVGLQTLLCQLRERGLTAVSLGRLVELSHTVAL